MKKIVVISDLQSPFHDSAATDTIAKFIKAYKPDTVVSVGDEMDLPQISRWEEGREGEWKRDLNQHREVTVKLLEQLQISHISRSNHSDRLYNKIVSKAPGFLSLPELTIEGFLRMKDLGITYHHDPYELAPGWILVHGDEGNVQPTAGATALGLAKRSGMSVVCGHTHRMGLSHYTTGITGRTNTIWGMEVGNLMDYKHARYIKAGLFTWNQGFGILSVEGKTVVPQLVPIVNKSFIVDGKRWNW